MRAHGWHHTEETKEKMMKSRMHKGSHNLAKARVKKIMTQQQLADITGMPLIEIACIENRTILLPKEKTIKKLEKVVGIIDWIPSLTKKIEKSHPMLIKRIEIKNVGI